MPSVQTALLRCSRVAALPLLLSLAWVPASSAQAAIELNGAVIAKARAVLLAYDAALNAGDLDAVMKHVAADVVMLAPGTRLVEGKAAFRRFFQGLLKVSWSAAHRISRVELAGDVVILHGVASGTMTPPGGEPVPVANGFLILLKPDADGAYRIWRAAFGEPT